MAWVWVSTPVTVGLLSIGGHLGAGPAEVTSRQVFIDAQPVTGGRVTFYRAIAVGRTGAAPAGWTGGRVRLKTLQNERVGHAPSHTRQEWKRVC